MGAWTGRLGRDGAVAVVTFLLMVGSFRLNQAFDGFALYAEGISLFFIPAGVELMCFLVGGAPALVGIYLAGTYIASTLWAQVPSVSHFLLALIGTGFYGAAVYAVLRQFRIRRDLSNLNYWHVVVLATTTSLAHGFGLALAYISQEVSTSENLVAKSLAIAFGDFMGCLVIVMVFNLGVQLARRPR